MRYSAVLLEPQVVVVQIMSAQHVSFTHGFPVQHIYHYFSSCDCNGISFDDHHIDYDQYIDNVCYDGYDDDSDDNFL